MSVSERGKADTSASGPASASGIKARGSKGPVARAVRRPVFGGGLLASKPPKNEGTVATGLMSTAMHLGVMGFLVYVTLGSGVERIEDEVTVMEITQEMEAPPT